MKMNTSKTDYLEDLDYIIGDEVAAKTAGYVINYPINRGIITNWEYMEKIWQKSFFQYLHCDPSEHPILMTEPFNNPIVCGPLEPSDPRKTKNSPPKSCLRPSTFLTSTWLPKPSSVSMEASLLMYVLCSSLYEVEPEPYGLYCRQR